MYHQPEHFEVGQQVEEACAWVPPPLQQCRLLQDCPPLYIYKTKSKNVSHNMSVKKKFQKSR